MPTDLSVGIAEKARQGVAGSQVLIQELWALLEWGDARAQSQPGITDMNRGRRELTYSIAISLDGKGRSEWLSWLRLSLGCGWGMTLEVLDWM